jgi:hypothetical protein
VWGREKEGERRGRTRVGTVFDWRTRDDRHQVLGEGRAGGLLEFVNGDLRRVIGVSYRKTSRRKKKHTREIFSQFICF